MSALNTQSPATTDEQLWAAQAEIKRLKQMLADAVGDLEALREVHGHSIDLTAYKAALDP